MSGKSGDYHRNIGDIADFLGVSSYYLCNFDDESRLVDPGMVLRNIYKLLSKNQKTQAELEDFLEIKRGAVAEWEAGVNESYCKWNYFFNITRFFDVTGNDLFEEDEEEELPSESIVSDHMALMLEELSEIKVRIERLEEMAKIKAKIERF
jgi:transcriptional regulator with XRE-family HTH domain